MSQLFGPSSVVSRAGDPSEYEELREILRRKLIKVPSALYPNVSLDDILSATGNDNMFPHHAHPLSMQVNSGATLAGMLFYRGEIIDNIKNHRSIEEWTFEAALAYFCSYSNKDMSFSRHFKETRARLYLAVYAKVYGTPTRVQEAYIQACAEENEHTNITNRGRHPTTYRERFIRVLQENKDDYEVCSRTRNQGILKNMNTMVDSWWSVKGNFDPNNARHRQLKEFGTYIDGFFSDNERVTNSNKPKNIPGIDYHTVIELNTTKFQPWTSSHRILNGLLKSMPGFRTYETVDIFNVDDVTDELDGLKVAKDVGLDTPKERQTKSEAMDLLEMPEIDLSRFGSVIILDF